MTEATEKALATASELLGCECESLRRALTCKQIKAGTEWILKANPPSVCLELCDGLAKAVYARLFEWLQTQLTAALARERDDELKIAALMALARIGDASPPAGDGVLAVIEPFLADRNQGVREAATVAASGVAESERRPVRVGWCENGIARIESMATRAGGAGESGSPCSRVRSVGGRRPSTSIGSVSG